MSHGVVRTASRRLYALRQRALFTTLTDEPSSVQNSPPPASLRDERQRQQKGQSGGKRPMHPRMIFVRPWDGIATMAHAFAIVRDIERRFGKVQEFKVLRDPDVLSSLVPFMHVLFARAGDADAIPPDGKVIQVVAPQVDRKRDGGIGLDELHVYLNPETREEALSARLSDSETATEWGPSNQGQDQVMDVKLERTSFSSLPVVQDRLPGSGRKGPPHMNNPMRTRELAHAIHAFGGFLDPSSHEHNSPTRMERLVSRWSRVYEQSSPPNPAPPPKKSVISESLIEGSEELVTSSNEDVPWTPFESESSAPGSIISKTAAID